MKQLCAVLFLLGCTLSIYANISVTGSSNNLYLRLDESVEISITCVSDTTERLTPALGLPAGCSFLSDKINITLLDIETYPKLVSAGVPFTVRFYIHSLDDPTIQNDPICEAACLDSSFVLSFFQVDGDPVTTSGTSIDVNRPSSNNGVLQDIIAGFGGTPFQNPSFGIDVNFTTVSDTSALVSSFNPLTERLMLYIDWDNAEGIHPYNFLEISWPVKDPSVSTCFYNMVSDMFIPGGGDLELYDGTLINQLGGAAVTGFDLGEEITQAPIGGGGGQFNFDLGVGVNVFDVTDQATQCGTFYQNLAYAANSQLFAAFFHSGGWFTLRRFWLVRMELAGCSAANPSFQISSTADFQIDKAEIVRTYQNGSSSYGVKGSVAVPADWLQGGDFLESDYTIDWYLLKNDSGGNELIASDSNTTVLNLSNLGFDLPDGTDSGIDETFQLMAVISYQNQAFLSTTVELETPVDHHQVAGSPFFLTEYINSEDGQAEDAILDPGEGVDVQFELADGLTLTGVRYGYFSGTSKVYEDGSVLHADDSTDQVGVNGYWPTPLIYLDESISISGSSITLPYLLLESLAKSEATFFIEVSYSSGTVPVTFTYGYQLRELDNLQEVDLYGQIEQFNGFSEFSSTDFTRVAVVDPGLHPTSPPPPSGSQLWSFDGTKWVCAAPSSAAEDELHRLVTPVLPLLPDAVLQFDHQTFLISWQEGGYIEYKTMLNSVVVQDWENIEAIAKSPTNLYDPSSTAPEGNSQLRNQGINNWVKSVGPQTVIIPLDDNELGNANQIVFRFTYQAPFTDDTGSGDKWHISNLQLNYLDLVRDNIFRVDLDRILDLCATNGAVYFQDDSPYDASDFNFTWYANRAELYQGLGQKGSSQAPEYFGELATTEQFVEMELISSPNGSVRIYPFNVQEGSPFTFCDLVVLSQNTNEAITAWPDQYTILDYLADYILCSTEDGDDCKAEYLVDDFNRVIGPSGMGSPETDVTYNQVTNLFTHTPVGATINRIQNDAFILTSEITDWNRDQNGYTMASIWIDNPQLSYDAGLDRFEFQPNDGGLNKFKVLAPPPYHFTYDEMVQEYQGAVGTPIFGVDARSQDAMVLFEAIKDDYAFWIVDEVNAVSTYEIGYDQVINEYYIVSPTGIGDTYDRDTTVGSGDPPLHSSSEVKIWADGVTGP